MGISWGQNGSRLDLISDAKTSWRKPMFMEIMITGAWSIWKERNMMLFDGVPPSISSWKERFKDDFALLVHRTKSSLPDFILSYVINL